MKLSPFMTILFTPSVWLINKRFDPQWDKELRELISKKATVKNRSSNSIQMGGYSIWIDSDFGSRPGSTSQRPSRYAICLLKQYIKEN